MASFSHRPGPCFTTIGGGSHARMAKLNPATGAHVAAFTGSADGALQDLRRSPDGTRLYVAGSFGSVGGATRAGLGVVDPVSGAVVLENDAQYRAGGECSVPGIRRGV